MDKISKTLQDAGLSLLNNIVKLIMDPCHFIPNPLIGRIEHLSRDLCYALRSKRSAELGHFPIHSKNGQSIRVPCCFIPVQYNSYPHLESDETCQQDFRLPPLKPREVPEAVQEDSVHCTRTLSVGVQRYCMGSLPCV